MHGIRIGKFYKERLQGKRAYETAKVSVDGTDNQLDYDDEEEDDEDDED